MDLFTNRNRLTDLLNKLWPSKGKGWGRNKRGDWDEKK